MIRKLLADYAASAHITSHEILLLERFLKLITEKVNCFDRQEGGHITASAWIIHPENCAVLLTHHRKLNKWLQLGGHCDGNPDVRAAALREAQEESGIDAFDFLVQGIFDVDIHAIPNSCEYHFDVRFLLKANSSSIIPSDESHDVLWVQFHEVQKYSTEESILRMNNKYQHFFKSAF